MTSSSKLVCDALSMQPAGSKESVEETQCGMCGSLIRKGDPIDPLKFPTSFTLRKNLFDMHAEYRCGYCTQILETPVFLQDLSTGVYHSEGFTPIAKKVNRGYAFLNPPKPPYVFVIQADRSQHTIWRAPVSYNQEVIKLLCGDRMHSVRVKFLRDAAAASREIQTTWLSKQSKARQNAKKVLPPPLGFNDLKGKSMGIGEMQSWLTQMLDEGLISDADITPLHLLTHSEAWALDSALSEVEQSPTYQTLSDYLDAKKNRT